ncbi:MAG: NAD(P)-dependent oxidoreductase [Muribaculaceae bacterium]|nr:NAD(P)-dependent oxidoreductase [Muribaculaceae bacterium]
MNDTNSKSGVKKVLIVGAGGFIGGHIAAEGIKRGMQVYAGVRESTSRCYLEGLPVSYVTLDYDATAQDMAAVLRASLPEGERWDYIIYNLGATKCVNFLDFNRINYLYLRTFVEALRCAHMMPERFLFMSSLSALGPGDEKGYSPLTSRTIPQPNTRYGVSKIKAETFLEACPDVPWTIFRPTGVYGPHEQDYLMMIKSIDSHFDFGVGYRRQMLTFIYVEDLVRAMYDALAVPATLRRKYIISEERAYSQKEFRAIVSSELGGKWVIPVKLPLWMAYVASVVAEKYGVAKMKPSTLNRDKFKIMKQRNWTCDVSDAQRDFGFRTRFSLEDGVRATVKAYRESASKTSAGKDS